MLPIGAVWQTVLENPLINLMVLLTVLSFGSYGLAVLAFTVLTRVITFPLTLRTLRAARGLQELQPDMEAIQKRYKDPKRRSEEQMKLYRRKTVTCEGAGLAASVLGYPVECDWKAQDTSKDELVKEYERHLSRVHSVEMADAPARAVAKRAQVDPRRGEPARLPRAAADPVPDLHRALHRDPHDAVPAPRGRAQARRPALRLPARAGCVAVPHRVPRHGPLGERQPDTRGRDLRVDVAHAAHLVVALNGALGVAAGADEPDDAVDAARDVRVVRVGGAGRARALLGSEHADWPGAAVGVRGPRRLHVGLAHPEPGAATSRPAAAGRTGERRDERRNASNRQR